MFKVYQEHENFGEYTSYDLALGKMQHIDKITFDEFEYPKLKFSNVAPTPLHTRFPRRIYFQVTRNCQLSCDYCYVKAGPNQPHLEKNVVLNLIDFMGKNGLMEVRLTGGEATIHPDFIEICERFFKNNIYISLGTNGLWINPVKEFLASQRYFCIVVTVDGSELSHGAYRQGTHKSLLNNLSELRSKNPYIRIRINMVVTKSNKDQYLELVNIANEISAESLTFLPLRPRISRPELLKEVLSADEFRQIVHNATQYNHQKKQNGSLLNEVGNEDTFEIFRHRKICPAGIETCNLSFDAMKRMISVFACSFSPAMEDAINPKIREPFIAGRFSYDDVEQLFAIWQDENQWDLFRDRGLKPQACSTCPSFGKSCGGTGFCHIQNHKYSQLNLEKDVKEQLRKQINTLPDWCEIVSASTSKP